LINHKSKDKGRGSKRGGRCSKGGSLTLIALDIGLEVSIGEGGLLDPISSVNEIITNYCEELELESL